MTHDGDAKEIRYVAPSQAAVDLLTSPGRSPAEGEAVLEWMARSQDKMTSPLYLAQHKKLVTVRSYQRLCRFW
jgi:hypothetical protein